MLNSSKIIHYNPHNSRKTRRIQPAQWEGLRKTLEILWLREDKSLDEVMTTMAQDYGFNPTRRQYVSRFAAWKWRKAVPTKVMKSALRRASKKPERQMNFKFQGREISQENMAKFQLRHPTFDPASSPTCSFPSELECLSIATTVSDSEFDHMDLAVGWCCGECDPTDKSCQVHKQGDIEKFLCMDATGPVAETLTLETLDEIEKELGPSSALMNAMKKTALQEPAFHAVAHFGHIVLEGRKRLLPQFHWNIARAYANLAFVYTSLKRYDESKRLLLIAVSQWAIAPGSERHAVFPLLISLVYNSLEAQDIQSATEFCENATAKVQIEVGLQHYRAWLTYREMGKMFADHGNPRMQEKLMQELVYDIQPSLFEPSNGIIARFLRFCCDCLTSERCNLALQNGEANLKRNICSVHKDKDWLDLDTICCVLLFCEDIPPHFDPSDLYVEILAATGMSEILTATTCLSLFKSIFPASARNSESRFEQICAAVGVLRSSENITALWIEVCPKRSIWIPESEEAGQARGKSKHKGTRSRSLTDDTAPVNSCQTRPSLLPGATSTLSDLDCFFDFSAFSSPSPTSWPTNFSPECMGSSPDMVSTPQATNHPPSFASILPGPGNSVLDNPLYEEMDQS